MSRILQINESDYRIIVQPSGTITLDTGFSIGTVIITGNLIVEGTTTTIASANSSILDNILLLNNERNPDGSLFTHTGITLKTSGIEIDRGTISNAQFLFNENLSYYDSVDDIYKSGLFTFGTADNKLVGIRTNSITTNDTDLNLLGIGNNIVSVKGTTDYERQAFNYAAWDTLSGPITIGDDKDALTTTKSVIDFVDSKLYFYGPRRILEGDTSFTAWDTSITGHGPSRFTIAIDDVERGVISGTGFKFDNLNIIDNTIQATDINGNINLQPLGTGNINALGDMSVRGNFNVLTDITTINELNVINDLRVSGNSYGTAPVVTNILYVTMDGSDTNDGSAQDSSKACRTISGATKSPLYQAGSAIKVAPGHYLENNPISVKAYTSIIGSDLRTTAIEPINKTQDIFHVHSSCYLAQMQFLNGRSGIIDPNIDRGAYAVSFPTFEIIDVYKSPYIQNCTNQSGPWLYDGTMFVPNQTVQIPVTKGIATFVNGQSSITVTSSMNAILPGMSINTAPQNQGFFSARTLILANKQVIKEQVIKFIELTYPGFYYQKEKCSRDVGYIIENVLYDTTFGGNTKSIEAGLFYWNGVASVITGEVTQTIASLNYVLEMMLKIIRNVAIPDLLSGSGTQQIFNNNLTGGIIATSSLTNNIGIITGIIANKSSTPTAYYSTGSELGLVSAEILMHENRLFIQKEISAYIDSVYSIYGYDKITCKRDLDYIIDALMYDMMFGSNFQSIIAARSYYRNDAAVVLSSEKAATIAALTELKTILLTYMVGNVIATSSINDNIDIIINIINNGIGAIPSYSIPAPTGYDSGFQNARNLINNNLAFVKAELIQFITTNHPTLTYDHTICQRDIGYLINAVYYDLTYGGNIQSLVAGRAYYVYTTLVIDQTEKIAILSAYEYLGQLLYNIALDIVVSPLQVVVTQSRGTAGSIDAANAAKNMIEDIRIIINNEYKPVIIEPNFDWVSSLLAIRTLILKEKYIISDKVILYIDTLYTTFNYDKTLCERDVGLIVDALSHDILLGGNAKSIDAGLSYYSGNKLLIEGEQVATVTALSRMETIISLIVTNSTVTRTVGNTQTQIKKLFFSNGNISLGSLSRNIAIIKSIITNGAYAAPVRYDGSGLFAATGVSADDVQQSTKVLNVKSLGGSQYLIELDNPTVGIGTDATLYFGYTTVYPAVEVSVPDTWASRRVDPWGSMGGILVDGAVVSGISPITSMVMDAFTQVNQGGRGVRVTNKGYAQLVSVFTIFSSIAVQVDNGGIASITNSNANFGEYCMIAKGYGPKEFSGTMYNPSGFAYNTLTTQFDINENYPTGYFPYKQTMCIFVPDTDFRPHISLLLEVEPPVTYINEQGMPGFLSAGLTFDTITKGDLILKNIDVSNIYIGQDVYIRDQYGNYSDPVTGERYLPINTVVTDVGPQTLYMSTPINISAGVVGNDGYFTLYTSGKAYYTILSSIISTNPTIKSDGDPIVDNNGILPTEQVGPEIASLNFLKNIVKNVASNILINANQLLVIQKVLPSYNGASASTFIENLFNITINIIQNGENAAPTIVKKGSPTTAYVDAATIILANIEFFVEEVSAYIEANTVISFTYNKTKCRRDVALICKNVAYDLQTGGNYNSVYSGLSYYSRPGTYHIVTIEENATKYDLFPDGCLVNFYQRSYMSASGYLFEYVGAGTNYGALPQVGRVDPNQKNEVNMLDGGKVFFTSTDQNGDFRIGTGLVISQATGVLSGRTFQKSLYAEMTPFILAIEG